MQLEYRKGYKYQTARAYMIETGIELPEDVKVHRFLSMHKDGTLMINQGYAWDGASGIIDTDSNLRASLVHDALYQLMRNDLIDRNTTQDAADRLFRDICKEDGTLGFVAEGYYQVLQVVGKTYTLRKHIQKVYKTGAK